MQELIKNRVNFILLVLCALFFVTTLVSSANLLRCGKAKNEEAAWRFNLEEKINQFSKEKLALEAKLSKAEEELSQEKAAHEEARNALQEESLVPEP